MTKPTKWSVGPAKTQISLGIRPVWSEYSLCAQLVVKDPSFLHAGSVNSDQTGRMPRLVWVFAGRSCQFVGFIMRWLIYGPRPKAFPSCLMLLTIQRRWLYSLLRGIFTFTPSLLHRLYVCVVSFSIMITSFGWRESCLPCFFSCSIGRLWF